MPDCDVLIVGAGPTGLALALFLAKNGVRPRIIDKNGGPGEASRAMVVHARTLEFYGQLDLADSVVQHGIPIERVHLMENGREAATFTLGDFGEGLSPYPFALSFPQDDHERLLGKRLTAAGVDVEWNTELVRFHDDGGRVHVTLNSRGSEETMETAYLCGCDGARSAVRSGLKMEFSGGTYEQVFFVADVKATGENAGNNDMNMCLSTNAFYLLFPIRSTGMNRIIGIVPDEIVGRNSITFEDIRPDFESRVNAHVEQVNWFSTYHVHHRVAEHFRRGPVFVCGDAGHVHSPAGGQGMNTGIGDAVNLSWKLASVVCRRANESILDTYETERLAFAHSLVESTDKAFQLMVGRNAGSRIFRTLLVPHIAPLLLGFMGVRKETFRTISQVSIRYPGSALSSGAAGDVHGGDRLPWVDSSGNFDTLKSVDWQLHVYGVAKQELLDTAVSLKLALQEFAWNEDARAAGLQRDAVYLVRPDGYVALAGPHLDGGQVQQHLAKFGVVPRSAEHTAAR